MEALEFRFAFYARGFEKPSEVDTFFQEVADKGVDGCVPPQNHPGVNMHDPDPFYSELK